MIAFSDATQGSTLYPVRNLMSSSACRFVGHRQDQRRAGARQREHLVLLADLLRDELEHLGLDLVLLEVDGGDAVLVREEISDLGVGDVTELRERKAEVLAGALLLLLSLP
jgi:hypothetical protein